MGCLDFLSPENEVERAMRRQYQKWQQSGLGEENIYKMAEKHTGLPLLVKQTIEEKDMSNQLKSRFLTSVLERPFRISVMPIVLV